MKDLTPQISTRKAPQQARSIDLVASILVAAAQVLEKQGAARFTTSRVAEKAGVSIGSLYQYFPNKAAILFQLQTNEWRQTTKMLSALLENPRKPPLERLRGLVHAFLNSECQEAQMRVALNDAAPLYRNAPQAQRGRQQISQVLQEFMREALPQASEEVRVLAGNLIMTTFSSVGKKFSESPRTPAEIQEYADAMADMFCAYLRELGKDSSV
jgi:AcrR family transcriptional regulator